MSEEWAPRPIVLICERYEDGQQSPLHSHSRGQLLFGDGGYITLRTENSFFMVPVGYALLIAPHVPHVGSTFGTVDMRMLYIEPNAWQALRWAPTRVIRLSPLLRATVESFGGEPESYDPAGRGGHLAALILDEIARAEEQPMALPFPVERRLRRLCEDMERRPQIDLSLDDWADALGFSRRTLTRRFRQETGMSFVQWRQRLRSIHAIRRRAEGAGLKEVAAETGYSNPASLRSALRGVQ